MKKLTKKQTEKFDQFLSEIPNSLQKLQELLHQSEDFKDVLLDYSIESVERLEEYYLFAKSPDNHQDELYSLFITYLGETVIKKYGGNWKYCNSKSDDAYDSPIILNWGKPGSDHISISPKVWEKKLARTRRSGLISNAIESMELFI